MSRIATPGKSSAEAPLPRGELPRDERAAGTDFSWSGRVLLLALNVVPLLHACAVVLAFLLPAWSRAARVGLAVAVLYLAPPILARIALVIVPVTEGRHAPGSPAFWSWWFTLQLQTLFARLPLLEELIRLVPSAYSTWLRLWGSHIGRLIYWAPGLEITDRSFLVIGDDVVLGGKARLGAHILRRHDTGQLELLVGPIRLGHRVMVGAQSAIGPGAQLADDEATHAFFLAPPFSRWRGGRRLRDADLSSPETTHSSSNP